MMIGTNYAAARYPEAMEVHLKFWRSFSQFPFKDRYFTTHDE